MRLFLVRHGEAQQGAEDASRGLTEEGRAVVERVAGFLASRQPGVDRIEHSEKLRARQTAEIFAKALGLQDRVRQVGGLAPNDDVESTLQRLNQESGTPMLVGHLPHLDRLACRLIGLPAGGEAFRFEACGVACFERIGPGRWIVLWAIGPGLVPHS